MPILASDFSGLVWIILAFPLLLIAAGISFFPAARGHWAGPVLAGPMLLFGLYFAIFVIADKPELTIAQWMMILLPAAIGGGSVLLWAIQWRARRRGAGTRVKGFEPRL